MMQVKSEFIFDINRRVLIPVIKYNARYKKRVGLLVPPVSIIKVF